MVRSNVDSTPIMKFLKSGTNCHLWDWGVRYVGMSSIYSPLGKRLILCLNTYSDEAVKLHGMRCTKMIFCLCICLYHSYGGLASSKGIWSEIILQWMKLAMDKQINLQEKLILSENFRKYTRPSISQILQLLNPCLVNSRNWYIMHEKHLGLLSLVVLWWFAELVEPSDHILQSLDS